MEDWKCYATHSGCPQGGVISPILSNVYLNEFDKYVAKLGNEFLLPRSRTRTVEYDKLLAQKVNINTRLNKAMGKDKIGLLKNRKEVKAQLRKTPYTSKMDKVMKYIRYADDSAPRKRVQVA